MTDEIASQVQQHYNAYPFPPEPVATVPPPGWNWRWSWPQAYAFCTGQHPGDQPVRILDAGCGSGVSTEYIAHQNPTAAIWAFDISEGALAIAKERCQKSHAPAHVTFQHLNLYDVAQLPGEFQFINSVGVLHHLSDPLAGLQALATKLAPGGIMHLFVYGALGRWEIRLMQNALRLLQNGTEAEPPHDLAAGIAMGRQLFAILPPTNRIRQQEEQRWASENSADPAFADMYLHPHEVNFTCPSLFAWIEAAGLEFVSFSNPEFWQLERVLGAAPELLAHAQTLPRAQQYRLIELLDPVVAHYEFFVTQPPLPRSDWTLGRLVNQATELIAHRSPCLGGWPGQSLFNYTYTPITLSADAQTALMLADGAHTVADLVPHLSPNELLSLVQQQVILVRPR